MLKIINGEIINYQDGIEMELVSSLPVSPSSNKIYILNSSGTYTMNYYDGSAWKLLGGGSNQISIGTTAPTDTTKLFLDITDKTKPILKWYDSTTTSWINISSTQIQSDWNQTDNTKSDYIKNKPTNLLTPSNIKAGTNINLNTVGNDVTINATGSNATSINNITVDDSARTNGTGLFYNSSTGKYENAMVNISGVVGSSQLTVIDNTTIASGSEKTFNHPSSDNIVVGIEEQIAGSSVTDTHVDFSDSSKYTLQDSDKLLFSNNKVQFKNASYCVNNYKFEETSGTSCIDSKGLYNGTYNGTTSVTGSIGNARSFNGTSDYIQFANSVIPVGKKTIKFKIKIDTIPIKLMVIYDNTNVDQAHAGNLMLIGTTGKLSFINSKGTNGTWNFSCSSINSICDGVYHTIMCTWDGTTASNSVKMYIDDLINPVSTTTALSSEIASSYNLRIGYSVLGTSIATYFKGILDEFEIYNDIINPSTSPTYLKTTGSSDYSLTTIDTITSLTIPITLSSANTTVKCLISFDNGVNWLYRSSGVWYKYTGDLTTSWTSSNLNTDLQTYFANLSMTTLTSDLSSLGIIPISFDMAFQLNTADITQTPSISAITMVYVNKAHNEFASYGNYSSSNVEFGVKRISNSSIGVKNLQSTSKTIKVNIVTSV